MNSLRARLLLWLLPLYLLSAAVIFAANYLHYRDSTMAFMDGQMHHLALAYAEQLRSNAPVPELPPLDAEHIEHDGAVIVQFWGPRDRLLASTWPLPSLGLQRDEGFHDITLNDRAWRVYTTAGSVRVQVVQSGSFRQRVALHSAQEAAEPVAILIPVTALLLWLAVWLVLHPLDQLVQAMSAQDEHTLSPLPFRRVPSELKPLINSMNNLLVRLKEAFAAQQRFIQDAAHELRTPLTAMKLQVENLRVHLPEGQSTRLEAGIERMQRLVEQLLKLAHQEAVPPSLDAVSKDLVAVLRQSLSDFGLLAATRSIELRLLTSEPTQVRADTRDLRSVFDNLLENALRYTPAGGRVDVSLKYVDGSPQVEVLDTGPGIPHELLERVFDRFYRVLGSGVQGSGLGLAIARCAAGRAGMRIELSNRSDRSGLCARVRLAVA